MPAPYGIGNWFHSRIGSSKTERASIVKLVNASKNYIGLGWGSTSSQTEKFANEINVTPSAMRTKIRGFMRLGFIKEGSVCPLKWTKLGEIWQTLVVNGGDNLKSYTDTIEELIIASSLSLYSFDTNGSMVNPTKDYRPLFDLFHHLNQNGVISISNMESLIGARGGSGSNYSYWITDLKNGGILEEVNGEFKFTNKFPILFGTIKTFNLPRNLSDSDWKRIQNDVLDSQNPYLSAILSEMEKITKDVFGIEGTLPVVQKEIVSKMIETTDLEEEKEIDNKNYRIPDSYGEVKIRRKQSAWSKKVKEDYNFKCCVPECDIESIEFIEGAHIKKYSEKEEGKGHRANPRNGLSLCPLCHSLFDKGYFTLSDDLKVKMSTKLSQLNSIRLKDAIVKSDGKKIKMPRRFIPSPEFIKYHQTKTFRK